MSEIAKDYESEAAGIQVIVPTGGQGKRMGIDSPKMLIRLGEATLLDRCVKLFSSHGFRDFVFLLGYADKAVTEHIDKSKWGKVSVSKCYDYAQGIAKGKALKHAIVTGKIDKNRRSLMVFPDDIFIDSELPLKVIQEHIHAVKKFGIIASAVVAKAHRYPYGVAEADDRGIITNFEEKPLIHMLTTTGIYVFEPQAYKYITDLIDLEKEGPVEFEEAVMPQLAKEKKIYAIAIPPDSWIAVNTQKELEQAQKLVEKGVLPKT